MIDDIAVCEEDDGAVGGEEYENVPDSMQVGEAETSPVGAEEAVIYPGGEGEADDGDAAVTKRDDPLVCLLPQLKHHQAGRGNA